MTFEELMKVVSYDQIVELNVCSETITGTSYALNTYICDTTAQAEVVDVVADNGVLKVRVRE